MVNSFDIKHSIRVLIADKEYSIVIIISMALCLAVSLFLFSQIYSINYRPLPFVGADKLVQISRSENGRVRINGGMTNFDVNYFKQQQTVLDDFVSWEGRNVILGNEKFTASLSAVATAENFFKLSAVEPLLGRLFQKSDTLHGAEPVVIIGYEVWRKYFSSDHSIIGSLVKVDGMSSRIIGIMPKGYKFPVNHDLWIASEPEQTQTPKGSGWHTFIGKLKPKVSLSQAKDEISSIAHQLQKTYPQQYQGKSVAVYVYTEAYARSARVATSIITIVSIAILAMGCFSVSNLLVVRNMEHTKANLIKSALGTPLIRIIAASLLESFWLCLFSTIIGLLLCKISITYLTANLNPGPFWWRVEFGSYLIWVSCCLGIITWLVSGIFPVILVARNLSSHLLASGNKGGANNKANPFMKLLLSCQMTCAFILMVFTGLCLVGLYQVLTTNYGVMTKNYIIATIKPPARNYPDLKSRLSYYERLKQSLQKIDGVSHVGFTGGLPGKYGYMSSYQSIEHEFLENGSTPKAIEFSIGPQYLSMMGVRLIEGRFFNDADNETSELVCIINVDMARKLWPNQSSVIGKRFQLNPEQNGPLIMVVGVAPEIVYRASVSGSERKISVIYRPMSQLLHSWWDNNIVIKTLSEPKSVEGIVINAIEQVDNSIAITDIDSLENVLARNGKPYKDLLKNFVPAALLAILMSAIGIYGVTKRVVMQKAPEVGILKAIGAKDSLVSRKFMMNNYKQVIYGVIPGFIFIYMSLPAITQNLMSSTSVLFLSVAFVAITIIAVIVFLASVIPILALNKLSPKEAINFGNIN